MAVRVLSPHLQTRLATCSPATAAWKWTGTAEKQRCFTSTTDCTVRNGEEGGSGEISTSWDPPLLFSIFICHEKNICYALVLLVEKFKDNTRFDKNLISVSAVQKNLLKRLLLFNKCPIPILTILYCFKEYAIGPFYFRPKRFFVQKKCVEPTFAMAVWPTLTVGNTIKLDSKLTVPLPGFFPEELTDLDFIVDASSNLESTAVPVRWTTLGAGAAMPGVSWPPRTARLDTDTAAEWRPAAAGRKLRPTVTVCPGFSSPAL